MLAETVSDGPSMLARLAEMDQSLVATFDHDVNSLASDLFVPAVAIDRCDPARPPRP
jgi:hypothetical protein